MKRRNTIDLILNLLIVVSTVAAVGYYFVGGPDILGSVGSGSLRYFTTDSNILAGFGSLAMLTVNLRRIREPKYSASRFVRCLKFAGTVSVTITLLTVVFFLVPMAVLKSGIASAGFFFAGNVFALHLSTPLLALVSLLGFEREDLPSRKGTLWGMAPTVIYSLVYLVNVVFLKIWTDWYGFTFGGKLWMAPVSLLAMYALTYAVIALLRRLCGGRTSAQL